MLPTPFPQSFWVREGLLCAGQYPGDLDPAARDTKLTGLLDCGIRCVLSLMAANETSHDGKAFRPYVPRLKELATNRGMLIECIAMPMRDGTTPTRKTMQKILDRLDKLIEHRRRPTCTAGAAMGGRGRWCAAI